ncbi:right-handed parallel beta-helix repeat-containing protein [Candidatus Dependentiae bacterium]
MSLVHLRRIFLLFLVFSCTIYSQALNKQVLNKQALGEYNVFSMLAKYGEPKELDQFIDPKALSTKSGIWTMLCKITQGVKSFQICCASVTAKVDEIILNEICSHTLSSKIDLIVVPELGSIESKLDHWIGPLSETVNSRIDEILIDDCCQTVGSTIDQVVVPETLSIESKLDHWIGPILETVDSKIDVMDVNLYNHLCCDELKRLVLTKGTIVTNGSNIIVADGLYTVTANIQSCITIDADNVVIDLCGFTLSCDTADAVIEILPGHDNIEIINGKIEGKSDLTNDGILTGSVCELVLIENIKVYSCDNGLNFSGAVANPIKDCKIKNCVCKACNKGAVLEQARKIVFENCQALNCIEAGFEQDNCQFNIFENCQALQTSNSDATKGAVGFSSYAGTGNLFTGCVAEGTAVTVSDEYNDAIGFLLTGSEVETKIINCIANSTSASVTTSAVGYGIFVGSQLNLIDTNTYSEIEAAEFSADGNYVAVMSDNYYVSVLGYDGLTLSSIPTATLDLKGETFDVSWSQDGNFLALSGFNDYGWIVKVLSFDGTYLSDVADSTLVGGTAIFFSVDFSPTGDFIAIGGINSSSGDTVKVFSFDGSSLSGVANYAHGTPFQAVYSVSFSQDENYLAIGGVAGTGGYQLRVLSFDGSSLSLVTSFNTGATVRSVEWSPDQEFLAVGTSAHGSAGEVRVFRFNGSTLSEVASYEHGAEIQSVSFSPDGDYLVVAGSESPLDGKDLRVLRFDGSSLELFVSYDNGNTVYGCDWSSDGFSILAEVFGTPYELNIFHLKGSLNCLIENNRVCNTTSGGSTGFGIFSNIVANLIARNVAYQNDTNFSSEITNVHTGDLATYDTLDNISAPYTPVPPGTCCQTVNSKLDHVIIPELLSIESKLDEVVIPELSSIESKLDVVIIPQLRSIESKIDVVVIPELPSIDSKIDVDVIPELISIESKLDYAVIPELSSIESKLDSLELGELKDFVITKVLLKNGGIITDGSNSITAEGLYTMVENISGCVTIDADKVIINMAGFTLTCTSADAVIEILPGHKNIEIFNGKIEGKSDLTNDGIVTGSDCQLIVIDNVNIYSCDNGLNFVGTQADPIKDCNIIDCEFKSCNKGVLLNYTIKNVFEHCQALNCVQAGFDQTDCQFNVFDNCSALQTSNDEANERAIGFSSDDGTGNLFKECVAEGTTKTESNFCKGAIGFLLTGSEAESKIIECVANSSLIETGTGFAYGILLEPNLLTGTLVDLKDSYNYGNVIYEVDWSPCGRYVAMVGNNISGNELRVLRFDGSSLSLITGFDHGDDLYAVHWSPCGQYIAVGGGNGSGGYEVRVFEFDGSFLTELTGARYDHGADVYAVKWAPSGEYLAIGGILVGSDYLLRVFAFDGSSLTFLSNYAGSASFRGIDWSPSGKYIAAVTDQRLRVLEFDGATVTSIASYNPNRLTWKVSWSPTEKYLGIANWSLGGSGEARVLEFNGSTLSLKAVYSHGEVVFGIDWSSHVKYLAIGGNDGTGSYDLRILEFDGSSLVAVKNYNSSDVFIHGGVVFSRSGKYLATGGSTLLNVFEVMYAPENCLLDSNEVCNATATGWKQGIGINGSGDNLYVKNVGFANDVNFNKAVYNVYGKSLLKADPEVFDNLWTPAYIN